MKTKKILALLLAVVMVFAFVAACADDPVVVDPEDPPTPPPAEDTPAPPEDPGDEEEPLDPNAIVRPALQIPATTGGQIAVGVNIIDVNGLAGWGNAAGNSQMRDLTTGHASPVAYTRNAEFVVNPMIVRQFEGPVENADGSRTWTITIHDDLRFSDGTPIRASNYAFAYIFNAAPAMSFAGTPPSRDNFDTDEEFEEASEAFEPWPNLGHGGWTGIREVNGVIDFRTGQADTITGIRLLDEFTWSITIDAETAGEPNFPFFFEITYIGVGPLPYHAFAPGLEVLDEGNGVFMSGDGLTYELLRRTIDDGVDGGFRYTMGPTAGPYFLAAAPDTDARTIVVQRNPYFHGTYDGTLPSIDTIILRQIDSGMGIPSMQTGEIDMLVGQGGAADILPGLELVEQGGFSFFDMPRSGSGGLFFHWDVPPTDCVHVRRAIAWTLDRFEFNNIWAAGHASTNDTLISVASWMYIENRDIIDNYITYNYTLNLANATAELEAGGWVLNSNGDPWEPGDGPRYQERDGELLGLTLRWFSPAGNEIGSILSSLMTEPANSVGIYFDQVWGDAEFTSALLGLDETFTIVLPGDDPRRFNMVNGGLGIPTAIHAVWNSYNPDPDFFGWNNWTRVDDQELYRYALGRRQASTREEYLEAWFGFISRFNVVLPTLPLNADQFHDFFREDMENYWRTDLFSWSNAIVWANLAEFPR